MKKLMVGVAIAAAGMVAGAQAAGASSYPPDDAEVVTEAPQSQSPTPEAAPRQALPATGTESQFVLQAGLVTVATGGVLVGASSLRRRRSRAA